MNIIDLATKAMQTAIKSVVDAIKTVVDDIRATSDTINTDVNTVKSDTSTLKTTTNTINTNVGTPTSTASKTTSANAHAKLNYLTANMPIGNVKSVQRGTFIQDSVSVKVPISTVVPSKCLVLVDGTVTSGSLNYNSYLYSLTANSLVINNEYSASSRSTVSWQVVEFY